jgi:Ser/Thr protein kinase RdoA (MazF antagonist)
MNNFFFDLTPDVVIKAIEKSGLEPTGHCMALNSYENRVYDLKLETGNHVIAKFYRPGRWSHEQILDEHRFLFQLQNDEVPVCAPMNFSDGETIHIIEDIYYAIWPRTGGRIKDEFTDSEVKTLGRLIARIHNTGASSDAAERPHLTGETYGLNPLKYLIDNNFIPAHCINRYSAYVEETARIFDTLAEDVPYHRIHADCHMGNLLHGNEGWFFLDFDDFVTGPAVQDIWMLAPSRDSEGLRQRALLVEGYREFRNFENSWLRLVEPLRALRYINYAAWIARRWDDPAFPDAFPHFGTVKYWEDETADLEEQLKYFHEETDNLPESIQRIESDNEKTEELTNKDYFWDMED